jgi:hypothetical protein
MHLRLPTPMAHLLYKEKVGEVRHTHKPASINMLHMRLG